MIQMESLLDVADNSGAKKVMCVKVLGGSKRRYASVGDIVVVSIRESAPNSKVKKGDVAKAVIVRTAKEIRRADGTYIRFDDNSALYFRTFVYCPNTQSSKISLSPFRYSGTHPPMSIANAYTSPVKWDFHAASTSLPHISRVVNNNVSPLPEP